MGDTRVMTAIRFVAAVIAISASAAAAQPNIVNAKIEQTSAAGGLSPTIHEVATRTSPVWVAYSVPMISGDRELCCDDSWEGSGSACCGQCQLENANGTTVHRGAYPDNHEVELEPSSSLLVFLRLENSVVEKVRTFSEDCRIDAGGRTVYLLSDVRPSESVTLLASLATRSGDELVSAADRQRVSNGAVLAIALQADPAAGRALEGFVAPGQPDKLREQAAFWLASVRGHTGYQVLRRLAQTDPDDAFRRKLMFDFEVSHDPEAVQTLIRSAQSDSSPEVRGQALFWLAQKAARKAAPVISEAVESDPDTEVKKRAVFALSQLPKDQSVPMLIHVAQSNSNPSIRKTAMFWLGQSRDPRALAFFEQILTAR
jgi:HEAT repeat protein